MKVRFVILLPPQLSEFVAKHSKQAKKKFGAYFAIDNKKLFPHITLCKVSIDKNKLRNLYAVVGALSRSRKPLQIKIKKFYSSGDWIFLAISQNRKISDLRKSVIKTSIKAGGKFLKPAHTFHPHITLTRLRKKTNSEIFLSKISLPSKLFEFKTIAVGFSDSQGQVYKILKKFNIRSK